MQRWNKVGKQIAVLSLILGWLPVSMAVAQATPISQIISYQGQLISNGGAPLADGTYALTFNIYKNNVSVFNQTSNVATVGGVFSIFLGVGALSFDAASSYDMGVTSNGNEVRHAIAAVPFALNAKSGSVQSDGATLTGDGTAANKLTIKNGGVGQTQVANGYVDLSSDQTVGGTKTFSSPVNRVEATQARTKAQAQQISALEARLAHYESGSLPYRHRSKAAKRAKDHYADKLHSARAVGGTTMRRALWLACSAGPRRYHRLRRHHRYHLVKRSDRFRSPIQPRQRDAG